MPKVMGSDACSSLLTPPFICRMEIIMYSPVLYFKEARSKQKSTRNNENNKKQGKHQSRITYRRPLHMYNNKSASHSPWCHTAKTTSFHTCFALFTGGRFYAGLLPPKRTRDLSCGDIPYTAEVLVSVATSYYTTRWAWSQREWYNYAILLNMD